MIDSLPPGLILILGALLVPLFRGRAQQVYLVILPALGLWQVLSYLPLDAGESVEFGKIALFGHVLTVVRIDKLSLAFGIIFHIAALLNVIFAIHVKDNLQHVSGLIYAGSAIGGAFAGDLVTLFVYWELTAISSVFLIWASRTEKAYRAGMRYLIVQVGSGVLLLAGMVLRVSDGGSLKVEEMGPRLDDLGTILIFIAFGIKAAFPLLHNWLQDAYPEATVTGAVFLSAFTTKMAIYALARGFPGTEILIPIGAAMAAFPIFFAVIENDLRRVLAYSLNNQLGFMVVGIGIGGLAINGTVAHAFCHILYKALLFMSMGAVLYRTGTVKGSELGGLYKSMPLTMVFCCVGAASISAFPLFSGFVSKSIIIGEAAGGHYTLTWFVLVFASAGVFHHSGIKIPFFAFFAHDSGIRCKEAPWNMLLAMGIAAALCIGIGIFYQPLYDLLPLAMTGDDEQHPYAATHWVPQLQLLLFSGLAFGFLKKTGLYPPELRSTNLDTDWFYRRVPVLVWTAVGPVRRGVMACWTWALENLGRRIFGVPGADPATRRLPRQWALSRIVVLTGLMLLGYLLIVLFSSG